EISHKRSNYKIAAVHAFVGGDSIIEHAPTDNLSSGVGTVGNTRFIKVEIVNTPDYAAFGRTMNNYAE
ncbi:hypothetical protein, partial [Staphylococcus aureus]